VCGSPRGPHGVAASPGRGRARSRQRLRHGHGQDHTPRAARDPARPPTKQREVVEAAREERAGGSEDGASQLTTRGVRRLRSTSRTCAGCGLWSGRHVPMSHVAVPCVYRCIGISKNSSRSNAHARHGPASCMPRAARLYTLASLARHLEDEKLVRAPLGQPGQLRDKDEVEELEVARLPHVDSIVRVVAWLGLGLGSGSGLG
jgi:hypothetical protein